MYFHERYKAYADAVFGGDVLVEDRVEDARKVIRLNRGALGQKGCHRESAESHVVLKRRVGRKNGYRRF